MKFWKQLTILELQLNLRKSQNQEKEDRSKEINHYLPCSYDRYSTLPSKLYLPKLKKK